MIQAKLQEYADVCDGSEFVYKKKSGHGKAAGV